MTSRTELILVGAALFAFAGFAHASPSLESCADLSSLKLKVKENHIDLKDKSDLPLPACVTLGSSFTIKIQASSFELGEVRANSVGDGPVTVSGNNDDDPNELVITVSGDSAPAEPVKYEIHVDGIGMLDPRVRVVDVEQLKMIQLAVVEEVIEDWKIEADVLEAALRNLKPGY